MVPDLNDTATYVITAYGRSDAGQDQRPTARLVLRLNPEAHELIKEELIEFMDTYSLGVVCAVVLILLGLLFICFCVQYKASVRRRERTRKKYKLNMNMAQVRVGHHPIKVSIALLIMC